ncbi:bifunctional folylpolyglutamate synthase/dihydrofolate synthase [Tenacibaculum finnmarkense genomovar finnmarkense]|uniref:bifunctional folylpolyglutamate synthase/dihydrofolate synthase n=1 Tax=Tenacibaculum finnmarkense TaxID=2781243 RepID=UPI001E51B2F3|nr:folylpolyglutamate synthase/dihydrofolate synthase family protein [Tenacibaculum finnmarkense]MCD8417445.1 bifunctional folylpolyglutamate synthase/dihydrofolate synthase [Tenacibaculum finnmarkense genomovar finnmarkense]MCG8185828.1 bifunctional folylpolyglutamate synthase/dihydrofolate synthase [Tenacibaculum finnmarkense genomovar finnmarkense]MCG8202380.1 bifunctional folylpolyglutamate synthase/dihydrofolate synthase [Tenacibaculum finnmarkense genomovar finnmarkense]MCG8209870.1 bifun
MTYQQTLDWMFAQLPMYQKEGKTAFKKDLTNSIALSNELGNPEKKFKTIHVGGTNGKGSTSHLIASVLQEAGYKVGLYTSPHLKNFTERIRINGQEIEQESIIDFISQNKQFLEAQKLSFFEMTVGMAFDYFAKQKVDIAIIEVGLGGRLDSTNIITPEVSVITNIGLDHTQFLGETLPEIAYEKAGIIKDNISVVVGERQKEVEKVFIDKASDCNAEIVFASDQDYSYKTDLLGDYQSKNVKTAVKAISQLKDFVVSEENIKNGLLQVAKNTNLKGRWQILQQEPKIICDTAHNKEGLIYTLAQLKNEQYKNLHIVLGVVSDKDLAAILPMFPQNARYYFCKPNIIRGLSEKKLKDTAEVFNLTGDLFGSVNEAFESAKIQANSEDCIYIGGSTFVVAEIL